MQGGVATLTLVPVWRDTQVEAPPGFETGARIQQLSKKEFSEIWHKLKTIDFNRYALLTDADFENTPPDFQHFEHLRYVVNNRVIVKWGRSYEWLKTELRAPLLTLHNELYQRIAAPPKPDPAIISK